MTTSDFFDRIDDGSVVEAIRAAESGTSGEIRVFVSRSPAPDALAAARAQFVRLGMHRTPMRNGVLVYIAPRSQSFAVVGDEAVHFRVGQAFWDGVQEGIAAGLRAGDATGALTGAVRRIGEELARHFPKNHGDRNDLPDQIIRE